MAHRTIDTRKPITLYDDRRKSDDDLMVTHVLYENEQVILVLAVAYMFDHHGLLKVLSPEPEHLLILRNGGDVQSSDYDSWYAQNPEETRVPAPVLGNPTA